MYIDVNKNEDQRHVELLIVRDLPSCRIDVSSDAVSPRKRADVNPFGLWTKRSWARPEFEKRTAQSVSLSKNDGNEQQHGCEVTLPSLLDSMVSMTRSNNLPEQTPDPDCHFFVFQPVQSQHPVHISAKTVEKTRAAVP